MQVDTERGVIYGGADPGGELSFSHDLCYRVVIATRDKREHSPCGMLPHLAHWLTSQWHSSYDAGQPQPPARTRMVNRDGADPTGTRSNPAMSRFCGLSQLVSPTSAARRRSMRSSSGWYACGSKSLDSCTWQSVVLQWPPVAACQTRQYSGRPATSTGTASPPGVPRGIKGLPCLKTIAGHGVRRGRLPGATALACPRQPRTASHALRSRDQCQAPWSLRTAVAGRGEKDVALAGRPHTNKTYRVGQSWLVPAWDAGRAREPRHRAAPRRRPVAYRLGFVELNQLLALDGVLLG